MIVLGKDGWIGSHLRDDGEPPVVNCNGTQPIHGSTPLNQYMDINVTYLIPLLETLRVSGQRFIGLASQKEHNPNPKTDWRRELNKLAWTDSALIGLINLYNANYGTKFCVLRLPVVYGKGPRIAGSGLGAMMDAARRGEPIELWGDIDLKRDFISIHDVVTAIECLAATTAQGEYQISGGLLSLREEGETVRRVFGSESNLLMVPEKANDLEPSCVYLNQKKMKDLGWEPQWDFERIVRELYESS